MTNQDNLPIWARILLGVPIRDDRQTDDAAANSQQDAGSTKDDDREQSVLAFGPAAGRRKRGWHSLMCPVPGKLRS